MSMAAADATIVFASLDKAAFTGTYTEIKYKPDGTTVDAYGHYQPIEAITAEGYTLTFEQNGTKTAQAVYDTKAAEHTSLRMYFTAANADKGTPACGNTITIEGPAFKSVTLNFEGASYATTMKASVGTAKISSDNKTLIWTSDAAVTGVTLEVEGKSTRFSGLTISTEAAVLPEDPIYAGLDATNKGEGWTFVDNTFTKADGNEGYVWAWNNSGYLKASAYVSGTKYATEAYAVSPVIDLTNATDLTVSFEHAAKFQTNLQKDCKFVVREVGATAWTVLPIANWPKAGGWTFVNSGDINLNAFAGKKIELAFKYVSTTEAADTWEAKNLVVKGKKSPSGIADIEAAEAEAVYYNLQGVRIAEPSNGIFIKVQGSKVTKVAL